MARPIVLGNGELHVGLNKYGLVHDFYYPYVGLENHSAGADLRHKVGVWVDGQISWLDDKDAWQHKFRYPHNALIGHTIATNTALGVVIEFDDCVDAEMSVFLRNIHVVNLKNEQRDIRLFTHQAFAIGDSRSNTDTAQYLPDSDAVLHYRGRRAFIVSGTQGDSSFDQHSIGLFGIEGHEGSYRDADDGELEGNNVEHGRVDSILRFKLNIPPLSSLRAHYWIAAGTSTREALYIHKQLKEHGLSARLEATARWWHEWLKPTMEAAEHIPEDHQALFIKSAMIIKSQMDKRGAVIASTDSTMLNYDRDAYAYAWPRDGAYAVWPLIRLGYYDEAYRFFEFSKLGMHPGGYLMHKYRADGALGSSWHPYAHGSTITPPIQEDETAIVVFVFAQFYALHPGGSLLKDFYSSMIKPMADFLAEFIDEESGLPKPSYDLWEQTFAINTYTVAVTYGALLAASELATAAGDNESAVKWSSAADDIQAAAHRHLYNAERGVFYKCLREKDGELVPDATIDTAAVFGVSMFGLFSEDSDELRTSLAAVNRAFSVSAEAPGLPRYEQDEYRRADPAILGNYWYITSLWRAQQLIAAGNTKEAMGILDWVKAHAHATGTFGEQIDPKTGTLVSPAPLTWSHAEYLSTLIDFAGERS